MKMSFAGHTEVPTKLAAAFENYVWVIVVVFFLGYRACRPLQKGRGEEEPAAAGSPSLATPATQAHDLHSLHPWLKLGYGRHKFTGLSDDKLSGDPLPEYNFTTAPAMLPPELSESHSEKVIALRERVSDLDLVCFRLDDNTLVRFLRARKWNVAKAEVLLRKAHGIQTGQRLDRVLTDPLLLHIADVLFPWHHSGGFLGHSRTGSPVVLDRQGCAKFHKLVESIPADVLMSLDRLHFFRGLAAMEEDAARRGTPLRQVVVVEDLDGLDLDNVRPKTLMAFRRFVDSRDTLTPEVAEKVLVVRAPKIFTATVNWAKKIALTPETADKMQVADTPQNSLALLREYMSDDVIPAYLGGRLRLDGDPECRRICAPGGPIPREILNYTRQIIQKQKRGATHSKFETESGRDEGFFSCSCCTSRKA